MEIETTPYASAHLNDVWQCDTCEQPMPIVDTPDFILGSIEIACPSCDHTLHLHANKVDRVIGLRFIVDDLQSGG